MARTLVRNEDFSSASSPTQVQFLFYSNQGFPWGNVSCSQVGALYLDDTKFKAVCRHCHTVIHENPKLAKDLGLYH